MIKIKNNIIKLCLVGVLALMSTTLCNGKEKFFFDSKSWIVNVAGDPQLLINAGLQSKVNPVNVNVSNPINEENFTNGEKVAEYMTRAGYGNAFINALTDNGTNDALLQKLALANAQKQDEEFGNETFIGGSDPAALKTYLQDKYEPILMHNYYCFPFRHEWVESHKDKSGLVTHEAKFEDFFFIFKVEVDKEQAFDIVASIGDKSRYDQLKFSVKYIASGHPFRLEDIINKEVPDLALRGVLLRRHPAQISIGENAGLEKGDLVTIYSQRVDKNGEPYSKRISRARVHKVWEDKAQINFEANTAGNRKNGDVVVRTRDSKVRMGLLATWQPHLWGGEILMDNKSGFTRSGIIHHFLMDLSYSLTDKPGTKFASLEYEGEAYKAPMFVNFGLGYGIGKTFLGFFDVMPFFIAQYNLGFMTYCGEDFGENYKKHIPVASMIRVPIGIRFSINMGYPTKFILEGGYAVNWGTGRNYKVVKQACDYLNVKLNGIFLNAGFIF